MFSNWINNVSIAHIMLYLSIDEIEVLKIINTLRPRRNEQHFADDISKRIFFTENV